NTIDDESRTVRVGNDVESGRVVIGDDNVTAESRSGSLALDNVYERPESGKDLDVILSRIVDLDVPAADMDLRHGGDTRHRGGEVWQNHVASAELVGEDATSGADIDILPEFVNKAQWRPPLGDC